MGEEPPETNCTVMAATAGGNGWEMLHAEMNDLILIAAAKDDQFTRFVLPFVCRLWRDRKPFWQKVLPPLRRYGASYENPSSFSEVTSNGYLSLLKWFWEMGWVGSETACDEAALGGHFEMLKWLRERGFYWNEQTFTAAAEGVHFEMMKWMREKGCPWSEDTCAAAAMEGHFEVLKWLRENGCPWSKITFVNVA